MVSLVDHAVLRISLTLYLSDSPFFLYLCQSLSLYLSWQKASSFLLDTFFFCLLPVGNGSHGQQAAEIQGNVFFQLPPCYHLWIHQKA